MMNGQLDNSGTHMPEVPGLDQITAMPKLEMHIHLEGTIDSLTIQNLVRKHNETLPRPLDKLYQTDGLSSFLETLDWVCSLVRDSEDVIIIADNFGRYCRNENLCYVELIINPTHWKNIDYPTLFSTLDRALDVVQKRYGVDVRLMPSILRQQSAEEAMELVEWMVGAKSSEQCKRLVGLSIDGNEAAAGRTAERFAPAYELAKSHGFGCTAHAGESSGPEGVLDAMDYFKADRIDHGIRVIEDDALTERVAREGITLNVCLSSNCTLIYGDIANHPFRDLQAKGVSMTLNTDDPVALKTTISRELHWAAEQLGLSMEDLVELQRQAVRSAFCNDSTKSRLMKRLDAAL